MNKIIAREIPPEHTDFSFYFDDDYFDDCDIFIIQSSGETYRQNDRYNQIIKKAWEIKDNFNDIKIKSSDYYSSYKECMESNGISYTSVKCSQLKKWVENTSYDIDICDVAEFLNIITDCKWEEKEFTGYCQGDWCSILYRKNCCEDKLIEEIGNFFLGCGTEFCIDDCGGYFVIDTIRWHENEELVNELAELYGCESEDLEVELYDGEARTPKYKKLVLSN